jgi:hypothetical protein
MGWYFALMAEGKDPFTADGDTKTTESSGNDFGATCPMKSQKTTLATIGDNSTTTTTATMETNKAEEDDKKSELPLMHNGHARPPPQDVPMPDYEKMTYIYHLCRKKLWSDAMNKRTAYFPPTFVHDGRFTRASEDLDSIVETANTYYASSTDSEEWIVLQINAPIMLSMGIQVLPQCAPERNSAGDRVSCLQILSGISTSTPDLIVDVYQMIRDTATGRFTAIGTTVPELIPSSINTQIHI